MVHNCAVSRRQISKKHQIRLDTPWLDPNKTLAEQEVTENDELILMYRFYYHMELQRYNRVICRKGRKIEGQSFQ